MQPAMTKIKGDSFEQNVASQFEHAVVPTIDSTYTEFGFAEKLRKIIESGLFHPVYFSGLSGNGKTVMVMQEHARLGKPIIRVQLTPQTSEEDLIGGLRLVDGETKFQKGPVLVAMEQGASLLLDEIDRWNSGFSMAMQGILEGNPYYVKTTGEVIQPKPGFNIYATANTKGRGDDATGKYVSAAVLDDALLERFPITVEQEYPSEKIELEIMKSNFEQLGLTSKEDTEFAKLLVKWAAHIRKSYQESAIDDVISTRRLVHIGKTYSVFGDRDQSVELCIARFGKEIQDAFLEIFRALKPVAPGDKKKEETKAAEFNIDEVKPW